MPEQAAPGKIKQPPHLTIGKAPKAIKQDIAQIAMEAVNGLLGFAGAINTVTALVIGPKQRKLIYKARSQAIWVAWKKGVITYSEQNILQGVLADKMVDDTKKFGYAISPAAGAAGVGPALLLSAPALALVGPILFGVAHLISSRERKKYRRKRRKYERQFIEGMKKAYDLAAEINMQVQTYLQKEREAGLNWRIDQLVDIVAKIEAGGGDTQRALDLPAFRMSLEAAILIELYTLIRTDLQAKVKAGVKARVGALEGKTSTTGWIVIGLLGAGSIMLIGGAR